MCSLGLVSQSGALIWLNLSLQIKAVPYASSFRCFLFLAKVIDFTDEAICARLHVRCGKCGNVLMSYFTYFSPTVVRKQWASGGSGGPDQCWLLTASPLNKPRVPVSKNMSLWKVATLWIVLALRATTSPTALDRWHQNKKQEWGKKKTPLAYFPLCQQVLSSRGRQRGILAALRWINTECSCVLSHSVTLSFTHQPSVAT